MSSEKISALPSHTLNSADIIPVANGGANYGDTVGQIETAAAALVHWSTLLGDLAETQVIPFDGGTPGTADTGISRLGAASLAVGNGTAGDYSGSLNANAVNLGTSSDYLTLGGAWAGGLPYGYAGIWHTQATPSSTNYIMLACNAAGSEPNSLFFNEPTGGKYQFRINNVTAFGVGADLCLQIGGYPSAVDTGISRIGAASLAVGNGTAGDYSGSVELKEIVLTDFGSTPTSSSGGGTAGTVGEIVQHSGVLYFCSVTGVAGSATWNVITMTHSA